MISDRGPQFAVGFDEGGEKNIGSENKAVDGFSSTDKKKNGNNKSKVGVFEDVSIIDRKIGWNG